MEHTTENAGSRRLLRPWLVSLIALIALSLAAGVWLYSKTKQGTAPSDDVLAIGRSLTIGGVTVELSGVVSDDEGVEILYSLNTSNPDVALYPVGQPDMANGEESLARINKTVAEGGSRYKTSFTWRKRDEGVPDAVDLHMGSFVGSRPGLSGGGQISLGDEYRTSIAAEGRYAKVPLAADILLDGRLYRANEMLLLRDSDSTEFTRFVLTIKPVDDLASVAELAPVGDTSITLTDDAGRSYRWLGTRTLWKRSSESRTIVRQELKFAGAPPASSSTLTLSIKGASEVVGPFVFEDFRLVPEDE